MQKSIAYKEWKEEDISAALCSELENIDLIKSKQISIIPEYRLYNEEIITGQLRAETAPRIDFRFTKWKEELKYFGEAKNLSLKNWTKAIGTNVNESYLQGRFIETGIQRIVSGKYARIKSFLIAYVVNGSAVDNKVALNTLINRRTLPPKNGLLEKDKAVGGYRECYFSKNQHGVEEIVLQHFFLEFDN